MNDVDGGAGLDLLESFPETRTRPDWLWCLTPPPVWFNRPVVPERLALSRTRLLTRAAKGFMCRSHSKSGDSMGESENENKDYIPLVGSRLRLPERPGSGPRAAPVSVSQTDQGQLAPNAFEQNRMCT